MAITFIKRSPAAIFDVRTHLGNRIRARGRRVVAPSVADVVHQSANTCRRATNRTRASRNSSACSCAGSCPKYVSARVFTHVRHNSVRLRGQKRSCLSSGSASTNSDLRADTVSRLVRGKLAEPHRLRSHGHNCVSAPLFSPPLKIDQIANFGRGPYPHHRALDHGNNC